MPGYGQFKPINIRKIRTDWFERQCWAMHRLGMPCSAIARRMDREPDKVRAAIVNIWYKEQRTRDFGVSSND